MGATGVGDNPPGTPSIHNREDSEHTRMPAIRLARSRATNWPSGLRWR